MKKDTGKTFIEKGGIAGAINRVLKKKPTEPKVKSNYQSNRDKMIQSRSANKPKSREEVGLKPKPPIGGGGRISRSSQNMAGKPKPTPSTAEIRAKNPKVVPGTRTNEVGAQGGGKPSEGNFKKDFPVKKTVTVIKKPEVSTTTKQGKPRTKAQMMAAKRIADGKSISDVKQSSKDAMKARAAERFAAFKAKRAEKKAAMEEYTPYDLVLEYLLSSEQVATIEEANYVMTEMDAKTIQGIVEEQKKNLNEVRLGTVAKVVVPTAVGLGALGQLAKKDPVGNARQDFQMNYKLKKLSGTGDSPEFRDSFGIPRDYKLTPEQKRNTDFNNYETCY